MRPPGQAVSRLPLILQVSSFLHNGMCEYGIIHSPMELGNTVRAVRAAGKAGSLARALVRIVAADGDGVAYDEWGSLTDTAYSDDTLAAHDGYAPFGAVVSLSGVWPDCNFWRFSSEYMDDDIGILIYNFRGLNSVAGTWLTRDITREDASFRTFRRFCAKYGIIRPWTRNSTSIRRS